MSDPEAELHKRKRCRLSGCTRRAMRDGPFCSIGCKSRWERQQEEQAFEASEEAQ